MKTRDAIAYYGSSKRLAQALDIWPHAISRWGERPPKLRQFELERLTGGELEAE